MSGGGRPKLRSRRAKKNTSGDQSRVLSRDDLTASTDSGLSSENQVMPATSTVAPHLPTVVVSKVEGRVMGDGTSQEVGPMTEGRGRGDSASKSPVEPTTATVAPRAPSVVVSKEEGRGRGDTASKSKVEPVTAAVAPQPTSVAVSKEEGRGRTGRAPKDDQYGKRCQVGKPLSCASDRKRAEVKTMRMRRLLLSVISARQYWRSAAIA